MISRFFAFALGLGLAFCTISYAGPEAKLAAEGTLDYADVGVGQWFDLLLTVDPKGGVLPAEGIEVTPKAGPGVEFKKAILPPPGSKKGYDRPFVVRIPTKLPNTKPQAVTVTIAGQGFSAEAQAKPAAAAVNGHVSGTAKVKKPAVVGEPNAIVLELSIIEPYHVYGTGIGDEGLPIHGVLVPGWDAPPVRAWTGGGKTSPSGKDYHGFLTFEIPFTPALAGKIKARVLLNWQACTERMCDPNEIAYIPVEFDVKPGKMPAVAPVSEGDNDDLARKSLWQIALAAIGAGLFALAMPCTYPLIPITISFFTKQAEQQHAKVLPLALAYGAGIVAIFIVAGAAVGESILIFAAEWWVNLIFAALFLYFGLSLIGLFDIRLPAFVNNLAARASGSGGYMSVFLMGATLVITSFTCTAPFVGSLLVFAAKGGSLWTVVFAMAVFGVTMAIPFVLLSLSPKGMQALPKSGVWMKTLKVTLGIIELGLVLKFVSNMDLAFNTPAYIHRELFLGLWAASFGAAGLYLLGFFSLFSKSEKWSLTAGRGVAAALMVAITVYLGLGAAGRQRADVIEAFAPPNPSYGDAFLAVVHEDYEKGVRVAVEQDAPIFLHFTGYV